MRTKTNWMVVVAILLAPLAASALSRGIGRDIEFPKGYDTQKAEAIRNVIRNERYDFVDGIVSYWPPDWGTRLSFKGDAPALNAFMSEIRELKGIGMRLILYRGRNDEGRRDSAWQLAYSHARPEQLTIYLNLNTPEIDVSKIRFPEWSAK